MLLELLPTDILQGKTVLYVGFRGPEKASLLDWKEFLEAKGYDTFDILEIWEKNIEYINETYTCFRKVICGDIRNIEELGLDKYDLIYWDDGPEHCLREELEILLSKMEKYAKLIVLEGPLGEYPQGEAHNNPYEKHIFSLYEAFFSKFNYNFLTQPDIYGKRIIAWEKLK